MVNRASNQTAAKRAMSPTQPSSRPKKSKVTAPLLKTLQQQEAQRKKNEKDMEWREVMEKAAALCTYGIDNANPFKNLEHPWKTKTDRTPAKKSPNKREKDAITTYDKGLKDAALWRDKCFEKGDKIRSTITKATVEQVAHAIVSEFREDSPYALAFCPANPFTGEWSSVDKSGGSDKDPKIAIHDKMARDRRMAWQALKLCPFYQNGPRDVVVQLVQTLMAQYNERLRELLHNKGINKAAAEEMYCIGTDHFLRHDIGIKDSVDIGREWPLPANPVNLANDNEDEEGNDVDVREDAENDNEMDEDGDVGEDAEDDNEVDEDIDVGDDQKDDEKVQLFPEENINEHASDVRDKVINDAVSVGEPGSKVHDEDGGSVGEGNDNVHKDGGSVGEGEVKIHESGDSIGEEKAEADEGGLSSGDLNSATGVINLDHQNNA